MFNFWGDFSKDAKKKLVLEKSDWFETQTRFEMIMNAEMIVRLQEMNPYIHDARPIVIRFTKEESEELIKIYEVK